MAWRLAKSLVTLRAELDAFAPHRNKASDGTIGNQEHAARASRHNPNGAGVVTALDITHDPAGGCDIHAICRQQIVVHPHPDLEYVISNRMVAARDHGWTWRPYSGKDDHTHHAHFGVGRGPDSNPVGPYDDTTPWGIGTPVHAQAATTATAFQEDAMRQTLQQPDFGPDKGKVFLVGPVSYEYIGDPKVLAELERKWGPVEPINAVAWDHLKSGIDTFAKNVAKAVKG